ncbi:Eco57I restriction-modification methylase domain-containing protein [Flavobacterium sp.]|uniref:type IIG restriction enzyme/methyltransferase n=1 Tax=Flavobacterium sp. TaxID=239 RepID=UPI00286D783F|nr:TaqI-like C-terminal specificity domain-containing protein [Flavobacterium sp.]
MSYSKIKDFDELEELFFEVLAEKTADRNPSIAVRYAAIPYLNSSLFEMTDLEKNALSLSNLKDRLEFPVHKKSILKKGNKNDVKPKTSLNYLLDFLDAYNFASESNALIQEENKSIINASVLGLIFEKINGYKDGSFFTPGFITMYMCRETIRKAVVEKFKTHFPKCENITDFEELNDKIHYTNKEQRLEANKLVNDIKIVDPAVGSGHFLVSALNEMIAIKSDLQILSYTNGTRVLGYSISLDNDELIIQNQETDKIFEYQLSQNNNIIPDLQNLQETLFTQKQILIENCLFGVDINPKSVMICQLRLWIELLKNAYYTKESDYKELHTLPNIDINIKTGNSLISKFAIKDNVFEKISGFQKKLTDYKTWVSIYKDTNDKKAKEVLKNNLKLFKDEFKLADLRVTKLQNDLRKLNGEFYDKYQTYQVFASELTEKETKAKTKLEAEINAKQVEIQTLMDNPIYANAFEWRFEFPEVLDDKGNFIGFDVVIGNPPYGVSMSISERNEAVSSLGKVPDFEIYYFFINLSKNILSKNGLKSYIIPNTILFNVFAKNYRETLFDKWQINSILDCTNFPIFDGATVRCIITQFENIKSKDKVSYKPTMDVLSFEELIERKTESVSKAQLLENNQNWGLVFKLFSSKLNIISKIRKSKNLLSYYFPDYTQGLIAYDKYKGQDSHTIKNRVFHSFNEKLGWQKWLWGGDVRPYSVNWNQKEFVNYNGEIANPRERKYFNNERILIREITNPKIFAGYTTEEFYNDPSIINILNNPKGEINTKSLLAILNSKLATFYHFNSSPKATKGAFPKILVEDIKNFPLPKIDKDNQGKLTNLVDQILSLKKEDVKANTIDLENEIDELVYRLYDLTPEEIAVVNGVK